MWTYGEFNDSVFQTFDNPGTQMYHASVKICTFNLCIFSLTGKGIFLCFSSVRISRELFAHECTVCCSQFAVGDTQTHVHMQFMSYYGRTEAMPKHSIADWR